jgi:uncharacterized protein affecting Mg2+/Co2+ transport
VLSRHWKIYDETNSLQVEVPPSPGVIGLTPIINPLQSFEYYSGTDLEEKGGAYMIGKLGARTDDGEQIDLVVPRIEFRHHL